MNSFKPGSKTHFHRTQNLDLIMVKFDIFDLKIFRNKNCMAQTP